MADQFFTDFATGDVITAAHLNAIKNAIHLSGSHTGSSVSISNGTYSLLAVFGLIVPAGKTLVLKYARYYFGGPSGVAPRVNATGSGATSSLWTGSSSTQGDEAPNAVVLDNSSNPSDVTAQVVLQAYNNSGSTWSMNAGAAIAIIVAVE